jgi:hypothetical protein
MTQQGMVMGLKGKRTLHRVKHVRCPYCLAPAVYLSHPSIRDGWPGCYVAKGDARENQVVGAVCPNCNAPRPAEEDLGEQVFEDDKIVESNADGTMDILIEGTVYRLTAEQVKKLADQDAAFKPLVRK